MSTRVLSCIVGKECLVLPACSLHKTLLAFAPLHLYSKAKLACFSRYLLTFTFALQSSVRKRTFFFFLFLVLVLEGLYRISQLQLVWHQWLGHRFVTAVMLYGLPWKWIEIILLFLRLHSSAAFWTLVDHNSYSISSKVSLLIVVYIMVFCIKCDHSVHFRSLIPKISMFSLVLSSLTISNLPCDSWT